MSSESKHRDCTFSFTPQLVIDSHLTSTLAFVHDVKDFVKERADLERDFARKLDALAKKHLIKNEKRTLFSKGSSGDKLEDPTGSLQNSVEKAWNSVIEATECRSKAHLAHAEALVDVVCEKLKSLIAKKDDARKKHMGFSQKMMNERDGVYAEKDKAKKKYDDACEAVESIKAKYDRASDDKSREKYKLGWHQEILDMNNKKNLYILAICSANAVKNKYFAEDVPNLLNDLHYLSESISESLKKIWQSYTKLETDFVTTTSKDISATLIPSIAAISPKHDIDIFLHLNPQTAPATYPRLTPKDFVYIPSAMWRDSIGMASDEFSRCYMVNKLSKLRKKLEQVQKDLAVKVKGIEGMEVLYDVYMKNPEQGDMEDVFDKILEIRREYIMLDSLKSKLESNIETIVNGVGSEKERDVFHNFQNCSFAIPTTCNYCRQVIWGVGKPGLSCKDCGMNAHIKCELKISPTCSQSRSPMKNLLHGGAIPPPIPLNSHRPPSIKAYRKSATTIHSVCSQESSAPSVALATDQKVGADAVVLYDYAPPDHASDEELAIMEGEMVKIAEVDDGTGWTKVICNDKIGLIPTAYIEVLPENHSEASSLKLPQPTIPSPQTQLAAALQARIPSPVPVFTTGDSAVTLQEDGVEARQFHGTIGIKMKVLFDFIESGTDEISVKAGQDVWVLDEDEGSGWITVHDGEKEGLIPTTYLKWII
ncbi:hypothetical protein HDU79_003814 [Rhizoclosmatium sp. JEL0117]|nr:hypothetical protein HDU79_003814 [Rhizoclosmatium sp. JEL0117]